MKSFKSLLKEKIEREKYVSYESLLAFSRAEGYKVATMDRRMREICELGKIEPLERKSKRGSNYIYAYQLKGYNDDRIIFIPNPAPQKWEITKIEYFAAPFPVKKENQLF